MFNVVPYIGTWIETLLRLCEKESIRVVPYIGTWIETAGMFDDEKTALSRTLYRYVD